MGRGMANPEQNTREGLGQGREGGGRQRNTPRLGCCAQLCRLCTAQRVHRLRNHGFVYLNNFPADNKEVSCFCQMGGLQHFSNRENVLWKGCPLQICTKVPYGPLVALHRDQEWRGGHALSLSRTHARRQAETKRRYRRKARGRTGARRGLSEMLVERPLPSLDREGGRGGMRLQGD